MNHVPERRLERGHPVRGLHASSVRLRAAAVLLSTILTGSLTAATPGKALGKFVVSQKSSTLTHAYVIEKNKLLKIVLSTSPLEEAELFEDDALQTAVSERALSALVIHLDEDREADSTFFFDAKLPAGLEVRQVGTFKPKKSTASALSGRVVMKDDDFSFSYDATFDAPITVQPQSIEALAADATPADHALWRLKQLEIPFDEQHFRSVVLDGNVDVVKLFLTAGMPVTTANALYEAVDGGKTGVVKLLLENGGDPNGKDSYGQSLVMTAASNHHPEIISLLIEKGADVNARNQYRIAPLAVAAEQGHLDIVKLLLGAHANVDARDTSGGTALSVAILRGYEEIVVALLAAGPDVHRDKEDLLALAAEKPSIRKLIEQSLKAAPPKKK